MFAVADEEVEVAVFVDSRTTSMKTLAGSDK